MGAFFIVALVVWSAAVSFKTVSAVRTRGEYVFSWWDGGALLSGKRIRGSLLIAKLAATIAVAVLAVAWLAGLVPFAVGRYAVLGVIGTLLILDVAASRRSSAPGP
jgi:hypothetical protein